MLNGRQIRLLELLEERFIEPCKECELHENGKVMPYWTPLTKYIIVGEAPGKTEVEENEPFIGKTGNLLWEIMDGEGFKKEEFGIINSVNCRPVIHGRNGKPNNYQLNQCRKWIIKFLRVISPRKILLFGNYARGTLTRNYSGIIKYNATYNFSSYVDNAIEIYSVHPSICIYKHDEGKEMLLSSIRRFKEL